MKNYWHIQLHPNDRNNFSDEDLNKILDKGIIGMGDDWDNAGGQPDNFKNILNIGDIVMVRHNGPKALVEITSNFYNNDDADIWFEIIRKVKVLSREGEDYKDDFDGDWKSGLFMLSTFQPANNSPFIKYWTKEAYKKINMENYINLLKTNKNIIFTGAPGTGKTYLAKEIAKGIAKTDDCISFVQFHPSYDYTDFVEGLRPNKEDGKEMGFVLTNGIFKAFCKKAKENENKTFVFIIDEINHGEISKIFGELFFAIDPGYRGIKGSIKTQYHNINTDVDFVDRNAKNEGCFYIPENVYIIGTMNDIDRSVESFDFAMRRRFAWIEIKPEDRISMFDGQIDNYIVEAKAKMTALNIIIKEKLGSHFQIGPAYFLKLKDYNGEFDKLWNYHLEILLNEYFRGLQDAETDLETLKTAYYGAH